MIYPILEVIKNSKLEYERIEEKSTDRITYLKSKTEYGHIHLSIYFEENNHPKSITLYLTNPKGMTLEMHMFYADREKSLNDFQKHMDRLETMLINAAQKNREAETYEETR